LIADQDADFFRLNWDAGCPYGRQNASPIWICACPGSFYERRLGYCTRYTQSFLSASGVFNVKVDHVLHPLTVTHDLLGQASTNVEQ
jgi:hypothetical protein